MMDMQRTQAVKEENEDSEGFKPTRPSTAAWMSTGSHVSFEAECKEDSVVEKDQVHEVSCSGSAVDKVPYEVFSDLSQRVNSIEHSIGSMASKIDAVLVKLEARDHAKSKRKETLSKIVNSIAISDSTSDEKCEQIQHFIHEELKYLDYEPSIQGWETSETSSASTENIPQPGQSTGPVRKGDY